MLFFRNIPVPLPPPTAQAGTPARGSVGESTRFGVVVVFVLCLYVVVFVCECAAVVVVSEVI